MHQPTQQPQTRTPPIMSFNSFNGAAALGLAAACVLALTARTAPAQVSGRAPAARATGDWSAVDQALGRKGAAQPGGVMRYSFPRSDLQVTATGVQLKPALALGSWVAFKDAAGGHAMMMGDLVLTEDEVAPVMRSLQRSGVEQTALHNHVLGESPRVMYMHVAGHDDPVKLAQAVRTALGQSKTPLDQQPSAAAPSAGDKGDAAGAGSAGGQAAGVDAPGGIDLDTAAIARALGTRGKVNGGVYQVSVPRRETIREGGREVPPSMGVATAINFQPTGSGKAAITGDFVMIASEVNPVIRALQENGIEVTALHGHMLTETPRLFFMHFWGNDDALKLARGLRAALDQTNSRREAASR
jgi:hypothetical protein